MNEFDDLVAGLEFEEPAIQPVTELSLATLAEERDRADKALMEMGELLVVSSQEARDIHSWRAAVVVELNRRING